MGIMFLDIPIQHEKAVIFEQSNLLSILMFKTSTGVRLMIYDYGSKSYVPGLQSAAFTQVGDHIWCDLTSQNYANVIYELAITLNITMLPYDFINHVTAIARGFFDL